MQLKGVSKFQEVLEKINELSLEDQEFLLEIAYKRIIEKRRKTHTKPKNTTFIETLRSILIPPKPNYLLLLKKLAQKQLRAKGQGPQP